MKEIKFLVKILIGMSLFLFSSFSFGAVITSFEITPNNNEKEFLISIESSGKGSIDIRIKDNNGILKVSDHFESMNSFEKRMNLAHLKDGIYSLEIEDETFRNVQYLVIKGGKLTVEDGKVEQFKRAQFRWNVEDKKLDLNWLMNEFCKSKFTIFDEESRRIYDFNFAERLVVSKRFDLKVLPPGKYSFLVKNHKVSFKETITIE